MTHKLREETVQVKPCTACGAGLLETDRFCRWCGASQSGHAEVSSTGDCQRDQIKTAWEAVREPSAYVTSKLALNGIQADGYHSVSGPLVNALVAGMSRNDQPLLCAGLVKKTLATLMAAPIWLILVLLSPLDAFVAARSVSNAIKCQGMHFRSPERSPQR